MRIVAPLTLGAIPLLITPGLLFHFDITPKIALFLAAVAFLLIFCIPELSRDLGLWRTPFCAKAYALLFLLQCFWFAVATGLSMHPALSLNGSGWRRLGLITFFAIATFTLSAAASSATHPCVLVRILWTVSITGGIMACYGIAQYLGIDPLQNPSTYLTGETPYTIVRPPSTLGHADYFAAALLPIVYCSLAVAQGTVQRIHRFSAYTLAVLSMVAIPLSGTRAALLGLVVSCAFYVLMSRRILRRQAFVALIIGLVCASIFTASPAGAKLRARAFWSSEDSHGGARLLLWRDSVRMIAAHPVFGYGPETFSTEFPRFQSVELARIYPDFYHESPHNILLDAAVQSGLPGAMFLLGIIALTLRAGVILIRAQPASGVPLLAGWLGLLVAVQFASTVLTTALLFYFFSALIVALASKPHLSYIDLAPASRKTALAIRLTAAAPACALLVLAFRLTAADAYLLQAGRAITASEVQRAATVYRISRDWMPAGTADDLFYSRAMFTLARTSSVFGTRLLALAQSFDSATRAVSNSEDRHNAWYNLAEVFAERNDTPNVERSLRIASAWAPNWFKPHWTLARVLALTHHRTEAAQEARLALRLDGDKHSEVAQTLSALQTLP